MFYIFLGVLYLCVHVPCTSKSNQKIQQNGKKLVHFNLARTTVSFVNKEKSNTRKDIACARSKRFSIRFIKERE
jgi:hypothetical protein